MSVAVLLGLGAAIGFGLSDYLAGIYARRFRLLSVLVVAQVAGLLVLVVAIPLFDGSGAKPVDLAWGALGGLATAAAILLLMQGFRVGRLSVVSPVSSLGAAGIPVVVGLLIGEQPSLPALVGLAGGLIAIWLVSSGAPDVRTGERSLAAGFWYGIGAGVGFALLYVALAMTEPASGVWPAVSMQVVLLTVIIVAMVTRRQRLSVTPEALSGIVGVGVAGAMGTVCFLYAARVGLVSIAAVIASLSPAVTVILARLLLAELLSWRQVGGLLLAGVALVLISL